MASHPARAGQDNRFVMMWCIRAQKVNPAGWFCGAKMQGRCLLGGLQCHGYPTLYPQNAV